MASATQKQIDYINDLRAKRVLNQKQVEWFEQHPLAGLQKGAASDLIEKMKKLPWKTVESNGRRDESQGAFFPNVPHGRYAIPDAEGVLKFYHVDRPDKGPWQGRVFVKLRSSDRRIRITDAKERIAILTKIAADPKGAALLFGQKIGECCICGAALTDEETRIAGIGPVCAKRQGWN